MINLEKESKPKASKRFNLEKESKPRKVVKLSDFAKETHGNVSVIDVDALFSALRS